MMVNRRGRSTRAGALGTVIAVLAALFATVVAAPAAGATTVVASDLTSGPAVNLTSFTDDPVIPFTSAGDGFNVFQRGVSATIPFALADDSNGTFLGDTQGIVDANDTDPFFGIADTVNGDTTSAVTATWVFDISTATAPWLNLDVAAMGDFESIDEFTIAYAVDGGSAATAWSLTADEDASRDYTMAGGAVVTLNDPLNAGAFELTNQFSTLALPLGTTGAALTVTVTALTNGGSEAVALRNLIVSEGPPDPAVGSLVITEIMQNPSAVADSAGEWFEITNTGAFPVDLEGWTIADADFDSLLIGSTLVVAPGDHVVLGNNADSGTNGGVTVDYEYDDFFLGNSSDELILSDPDGDEYDRVEWDNGATFPDPNGASMSLDPGSTDIVSNDNGANWCEATTEFGLGDKGTPGVANPACPTGPPPLSFIHDIQGSGSSVAISGPVSAEGIVTALFTRDDVVDGFFVQEEDADADADPATSEGIFVFCRGNCPAGVATGDLVELVGSAVDFFGMSQINVTGGSATIASSGNPLPTSTTLALPASGDTRAEATFEAVEGMLVTFDSTLAVSEYFQLGRFGQVVLTETSRPFQFTHLNAPSVAGYAAFLDDLATRRIILDDDNNDQNDPISDGPDEAYPQPEGGLSLTNKFRGGDTITNLTGVMHWSFAGFGGTDAWRIRPVPDAFDYLFESDNPAPASPPAVGGSLQVASFNVLNYFTTIDTTSDNNFGDCGPSGTLDCRGADSAAELARQRAKILAALEDIDADVVGLIELENDGDDSSIADLVAGLNASLGAGTYDYVATGFIGEDAIKVGLIYQPATVTPLGGHVILDDSVDPTFVEAKNRPVLIQSFVDNANDERFTVAVNHLKSKGSACDDVGDPGLDDGQANCPATRTAGATALANYLATDPTHAGDGDFLIMGDLNAYAMEDAITALTGAGYTDLLAQFQGTAAYSFVFDGQLGYLDHALANPNLLDQVTEADTWSINADEVNVFDYNDDVRDVGEASFERESGVLPVYAPDALRSSDHDPVLVGLALDSIPDNPTCQGLPATIIGTPGDDVIVGTNGDDVIMTFGGHDVIDGGNGNDVICAGYGDDIVNGGNGVDLIDGEEGDDTLDGGRGDDTVLGGAGDDDLQGGPGDDTLDGGDGDDTGDGGLGFDTCPAIESAFNCEA